jgi:nucleoside-diphosphate-sugar epimerase
VLFHLAGTRRSDGAENVAVACAELNVSATVHLLDAARQAGVGRLIIMGSADEYGDQPGPLVSSIASCFILRNLEGCRDQFRSGHARERRLPRRHSSTV